MTSKSCFARACRDTYGCSTSGNGEICLSCKSTASSFEAKLLSIGVDSQRDFANSELDRDWVGVFSWLRIGVISFDIYEKNLVPLKSISCVELRLGLNKAIFIII